MRWLILCFSSCCVAVFWCFVAWVQMMGYQKVFDLHINIFGCDCRPCTTEAGDISNLFTHYCLYMFDYCLICRTLILIICCSFYCRAGNPITISRFVKCSYGKQVALSFEL